MRGRWSATVLLGVAASCATVQTTQPGEVGVTREQHIHPYLVQEVHAVAAREYAEIVRRATQRGMLDRDPAEAERVRRITERLVAETGVYRPDAPGWAWEIHVITARDVNAWCMPGGKMVIYTGFLEALQPTDDELAWVIGHEIAHALRLHAVERISRQLSHGVLLTAAGWVLGLDEVQAQLADLVTELTFTLRNSREHEREADRMGIELAARAGFDPTAALTMLRKMDRAVSARGPEWLSTHPSSTTRIRDVTAAAQRVMPLYELAVQRLAGTPAAPSPVHPPVPAASTEDVLHSPIRGWTEATVAHALEEARRELDDLAVNAVIARLEAIAAWPGPLDPSDRTRAYTLLGIAHALHRDGAAAQAAFHEALWLDGQLQIDSLYHLGSGVARWFQEERQRWSSVLRVTSVPSGAEVFAHPRRLGRTLLERPVPGGAVLDLEARFPTAGRGSARVALVVPEETRVSVRLPVPEDTLAWPVFPTDAELHVRFDRASGTEWRPGVAPPIPPKSIVPVGFWLGASAGALVGYEAAHRDLAKHPRRELRETWRKPVLSVAAGVLVAIPGAVAGHFLLDHRRERRRQPAMDEYQRQLRIWELQTERDRLRWIIERMDAARGDALAARQRVMERNAAIRERNSNLPPEPIVTVEPLARDP